MERRPSIWRTLWSRSWLVAFEIDCESDDPKLSAEEKLLTMLEAVEMVEDGDSEAIFRDISSSSTK